MRDVMLRMSLVLVAVAGLHAGTEGMPAWLLYDTGRTWASQGEFGKALQFYKEAILAAGIMPEAEAAIGDIYREEGEFRLAERQYERAYNQKNALGIPAEKYDILYRWAGLYEDQELYGNMERKLQLILDDDRWGQGEQLPVQIERNYVEKGLDRVLELYRFDSGFATAAYSRLGWFYYRTGRYPQAVRHLLYAVILQISGVEDFLKERDPGEAVTGLEGLFGLASRDREVRSWLAGSTLVSDLYYLSAAAWELGHPLRARSVWTRLAKVEAAGRYAELSKRQMVKPFREPFLEPSYQLQTMP